MSQATDWEAARDRELQLIGDQAYELLVDRAVVHVKAVQHGPCDCACVLRLTLDDGSVVDISGGYGGYTGHSCDEYVQQISADPVPA